MAIKKRLIDINELIAYFKEQCDIAAKDPEIESAYVLAALKCCIDFFQSFPTVDAVEVVHGEWVACGDGDGVPFMCSHCGKTTAYQYKVMYGKYCPNCGAKMDGGSA